MNLDKANQRSDSENTLASASQPKVPTELVLAYYVLYAAFSTLWVLNDRY